MILRKRWRFKTFIYFRHYNRKPINKKQFIFESFLGKFYSDSPKYIYEYLYENFSDEFDFVWVINDKSVKIPGNPKKVKRAKKQATFYKKKMEHKALMKEAATEVKTTIENQNAEVKTNE